LIPEDYTFFEVLYQMQSLSHGPSSNPGHIFWGDEAEVGGGGCNAHVYEPKNMGARN
jgi:hypothetical protein